MKEFNIENIKVNDVFHWSWCDIKDEYTHDLYWCKAQLAIVKNNNDFPFLEDLYWGSSSNSTKFPIYDINKKIEVQYLGNLDDYEKANSRIKSYYNPKDILDLSHKNSFGEQIYLKKGAQKDLSIMQQELTFQIKMLEDDIRYKNYCLNDLKTKLETLTVDTYL